MSREALLAAVAADPDADLPRLVYADWLDDHGEADRAEFIRLQCRTARTDPTDPLWLPSKLREYELFARHRAEWPSGWNDDTGRVVVSHWRRGFPDWARINDLAAGQNGRYYVEAGHGDVGHLRDAIRQPALAPVRALSVGDLDPALGDALQTDWCRTIREVSVPHPGWGLEADRERVNVACEFLARLPAGHWPALRRVRLHDKPSATALHALADAPAAGTVTAYEFWLDRADEPVAAAALDRFAGDASPRTEELDLQSVYPDHVTALVRHHWPRLSRLALRDLKHGGPAVLLRARLPALTDLTLGMPTWFRGEVEPAQLALAGSPVTARLARLELLDWPATTVVEFFRRYTGRSLRTLSISVWPPADAVPLAELAGVPALQRLRTLSLSRAVDLTPLMEPAVFPELHSVRIAGTPLSDPSIPLRWRDGQRTVASQLSGFPNWGEFDAWTAG